MSASTDKTQLESLIKIAKEKQDKLNYYTENTNNGHATMSASQVVMESTATRAVVAGATELQLEGKEVEITASTADVRISADNEVIITCPSGLYVNGTKIA